MSGEPVPKARVLTLSNGAKQRELHKQMQALYSRHACIETKCKGVGKRSQLACQQADCSHAPPPPSCWAWPLSVCTCRSAHCMSFHLAYRQTRSSFVDNSTWARRRGSTQGSSEEAVGRLADSCPFGKQPKPHNHKPFSHDGGTCMSRHRNAQLLFADSVA